MDLNGDAITGTLLDGEAINVLALTGATGLTTGLATLLRRGLNALAGILGTTLVVLTVYTVG